MERGDHALDRRSASGHINDMDAVARFDIGTLFFCAPSCAAELIASFVHDAFGPQSNLIWAGSTPQGSQWGKPSTVGFACSRLTFARKHNCVGPVTSDCAGAASEELNGVYERWVLRHHRQR